MKMEKSKAVRITVDLWVKPYDINGYYDYLCCPGHIRFPSADLPYDASYEVYMKNFGSYVSSEDVDYEVLENREMVVLRENDINGFLYAVSKFGRILNNMFHLKAVEIIDSGSFEYDISVYDVEPNDEFEGSGLRESTFVVIIQQWIERTGLVKESFLAFEKDYKKYVRCVPKEDDVDFVFAFNERWKELYSELLHGFNDKSLPDSIESFKVKETLKTVNVKNWLELKEFFEWLLKRFADIYDNDSLFLETESLSVVRIKAYDLCGNMYNVLDWPYRPLKLNNSS